MIQRMREIGWAVRSIFGFSGFVNHTDASQYYTYLGDDVIDTFDEGMRDPAKSLWLNAGYWKEARNYDDACRAMAILVGEAAELGQGQTVLDAGFGYADQDIAWIEHFDVARIVGVNITPLHVDVAKKRAAERGLQDRLDLRLGSATNLDFDSGTFDKVIALESAFHFNTREAFFAEAYRVLRSGGRLAATDMLPSPAEKWNNFVKRWGRKRVCIPEANMYDRHVYAQKLEQSGFIDISINSIREFVYPGMAKYIQMRIGKNVDRRSAEVELQEEDIRSCSGVGLWQRSCGISDYIVASARKR